MNAVGPTLSAEEPLLIAAWLRALARARTAWLRCTWAGEARFAGLAIGHAEADRLLQVDRDDYATFATDDVVASHELDEARRCAAAHFELGDQGRAPLLAAATAWALTDVERDVLFVATMVDLQPELARLCAYLVDDAARPWCSPAILAALLEPLHGRSAVARVLAGAAGGLERFGLCGVDRVDRGSWAAAPVWVDGRVRAIALGDGALDPRLAAALAPLASSPLPPRFAPTIDRTAGLLELGADRITLTGSPTAPLDALAASAAGRIDCTAVRLNVGALGGGPAAESAALVAREAALCGLVLVVDEELPVAWPPLRAPMLRLATATSQVPAGRVVRVPTPTQPERVEMLRSALLPRRVDDDALGRIAAQFPLAPDGAREAAATAISEASTDGGLVDTLWSACRERARCHAPGLVTLVEPSRRWDDLILPAPVLARLHELAAQVVQRPRVYDEWGFGGPLGRARGITALFAGPSGTGKTLAAEVLAGELGVDLQRVDLAGVVDKYIGETEKHLGAVFDAAERSGALLFFDEADALFGKRTEVRDSHDRYANLEVDYLLQRMEAYPGLAVLATNRRRALDGAFLRRLRFVIEFPVPDVSSRRRIWERALPTEAPTDDLALDVVSRLELSGGSIVNVAVNAAFAAATSEQPIGMAHLESAALAELEKLERLVRASDFSGWQETAA